MSPRAACRLEAFGFETVYDYTLGIADWKAAGLPVDGESVEVQLVADVTRPDVPTATPDELLGAVLDRTKEAGWEEAIVVDCDGVVIGRLRGAAWNQDGSLPVSQVMENGPTTVRANTVLEPLVGRMEERGTELVTVTTPQGMLIGVLLFTDAQRLLTGETPEQIWIDCDGCPGRWSAG
jgi:CBS domain-containing protein